MLSQRQSELGKGGLAHQADVISAHELDHGRDEALFVARLEGAGQLHVLRKDRVLDLAAAVGHQALHAPVGGIGQHASESGDLRHGDQQAVCLRYSHRLLGRCGIGPHQPSRPQQRAAKVAGHHATHVRQAGPAQHLQRGHTARALGLSVVGAPLAAVGQYPGRHVVTGIVMPRTHLGNELVGLPLGGDVTQLRDEAAAAVYEFAGGLETCGQRLVSVGAHHARATSS